MMLSNKSYLMKATHEWLVDSSLTPSILVRITPGLLGVPEEVLADSDTLAFNISPNATRGLVMSETSIQFLAKFAGKSMAIYIPINTVLLMYADENNIGMDFDYTEDYVKTTPSYLRVIK